MLSPWRNAAAGGAAGYCAGGGQRYDGGYWDGSRPWTRGGSSGCSCTPVLLPDAVFQCVRNVFCLFVFSCWLFLNLGVCRSMPLNMWLTAEQSSTVEIEDNVDRGGAYFSTSRFSKKQDCTVQRACLSIDLEGVFSTKQIFFVTRKYCTYLRRNSRFKKKMPSPPAGRYFRAGPVINYRRFCCCMVDDYCICDFFCIPFFPCPFAHLFFNIIFFSPVDGWGW